ncbi:chromate transporter, partial [Acidovorax sp. Root70]|uniref:chromate transporter n=1 Tax=Acidovorax sp. Root70 TaxID=1736590 RepID=UPI001F431AB4
PKALHLSTADLHRLAISPGSKFNRHGGSILNRRQHAMAGVNAAVVGVLAAALYDPVWTSAIHSRADFGLALAAFGLLVYGRQSPVLVVALAAMAGWLLAM